jgi:hypothetical protein
MILYKNVMKIGNKYRIVVASQYTVDAYTIQIVSHYTSIAL